jgi:hypothetical protein
MEIPVCLSCGRPELEKPLLIMLYQSKQVYICPQCLPVLIHKPASLSDRLPGAETFGPPAEHHQ